MDKTYIKNIMAVMSGGVIAQVIGLGVIPIYTRLYDPYNFGVFALFISITNIVLIIGTLRLDFAIQISKSQTEIRYLQSAVLGFTTLLVLVFGIALYNLPEDFMASKFDANIDPLFILLSAVLSVITALGMSTVIWNKSFKELSLLRVAQALVTVLFTISLSFWFDSGLVLGYLFGLAVVSFYYIGTRRVHFSFDPNEVHRIVSKYSKYPRFSVPSDLLNTVSNTSLPLLIAALFDPYIAGLYFMSERLVRAPLGVLYQSISNVYTESAGKLFHEARYEDLFKLTLFTQGRLALLITPFLSVLSVFGGYLFSIFLSDEWAASGDFVKYFSVFILFNGLYSPVSQLGNILGMQKHLLVFNFSLSLGFILSYYLLRGEDFTDALLVSSVVGAVHFLLINIFVLRKLRSLSDEKYSS